ncbi:MAG: diguanylate cyclase [Clostridia bacterium]
MKQKFEAWCYGGRSKAFFKTQGEAIHQYNSEMMDRLLVIMTLILGTYLAVSTVSEYFPEYASAYLVCFILLFLMLCTFKLAAKKSVLLTRIYIILFAVVMFAFVSALGIFFEPDARSTLFIVYVLALPMLFVIPIHHMYAFLALAVAVFSMTALRFKDLASAQMDIAHSVTCLVIGIILSQRILESRMALYETNEQLDTRNLQLENEITNRKQEQEELRLRLEQHQIIMDQTTDILFEWDIRKDVLEFSSNWRKKFGYDAIASAISGRIPLSKNIHTEDMPAFIKIMKDTAAGVPYSEAEFRIKNSKGRYLWCHIRATAQFDSAGRAIKAVGVILDINEEKKEKQKLQKLAQRDSLTGIYNKAATNALVAHCMEDFDCTVLQALMMIDVDYFKSVNDTYGHMAGDNLLAAVAAQLKSNIRGGDVAGRIGGDEFLVYLPEVESEDAALRKAKALHTALDLLSPKPGAPHITVSIGMAVFPHGTVAFSDLYRYADEALYQRKDEGRDGVSVYDAHSSLNH